MARSLRISEKTGGSMPQRGRALGTGRVTGIRVLGKREVCIVGLAENRAGHIINSLYFKLNSLML